VPKDSLGAVLRSWNLLTDAVEKNDSPLPQAAELSRELAELRAELLRAKARHLDLLAQTLQASRHLRETTAKGKSVESRLRSLLKGIYGSDSAQLQRYGIQPRREPRKRKEKEEEGEAPSS
jgi:hypothetical protein